VLGSHLVIIVIYFDSACDALKWNISNFMDIVSKYGKSMTISIFTLTK
jgi:hypothetical protein